MFKSDLTGAEIKESVRRVMSGEAMGPASTGASTVRLEHTATLSMVALEPMIVALEREGDE